MKKQNVLMAHNYYKVPGGEDTVFHNEVKMLEQNGHKVTKYTRHNDEIKGGVINKLKLGIDTIFSFKTYKEVKELIDKNNIDVVHVHNTLPLISPSIYYAAMAKKVPVVQTIHNFRLLCPGATFTKNGEICEECISKGLSQSLKNRCYRSSFFQTLIMYTMLKTHRIIGTYRKINYIALTEFNKGKLLNLIKNENQIYVKPNFVELDKCFERNIGDYFVYIGRLEKIKGINLLLETWKNIDENIKLIIIGRGEEEENIKAFIRKHRCNNIKYVGFKETKDAYEIVRNSRAIIVPSIWNEPFGMVIIEAFSMQVPVIANNVGSIPYIVTNSIDGIIVESKNKKQLEKAIKDIFYNENLNKIMGKNAYKTFKEKYTDKRNYEILKKIYDNLLRQS